MRKYAKLVMVSAENNNKYYSMQQRDDQMFDVTYGRVQLTELHDEYPMSMWDKKYKEKIKKGYKDVTHLVTEKVADPVAGSAPVVADIKDLAVRTVINQLSAYANKTISENYQVSKEAVTQAMVDEAQAIVDEIASMVGNGMSIQKINDNLVKLYTVIPRKMRQVKSHLLGTPEWLEINSRGTTPSDDDMVRFAKRMLDAEQSTLDTMAGQVMLIANAKAAADPTSTKQVSILDQLGITMVVATDAEVDAIKKMLGPDANRLVRAYKTECIKTSKSFDKHIASAADKKTEMFFHGSRNQNWFNIMQTGLMIRPSCAVYTGSMFGDGLYFADKAAKSIGYSSLSGSYWAKGNSSQGFLGIFATHVGRQMHIHKHDSSCYKLNKRGLAAQNFDSVFAHGGADLRNNEYIVYDTAQCTIKYLCELK